MSIHSDKKAGALSDDEFRNLSIRENRKERYIDEWERYAYEDEDLVIDDDEYPYGYNP